MSFYYLLLGHLLGDFTFQTGKIALYKTKDNRWNALHVAIVTVCLLFFSLPFGLVTMSLVLVNGILHYFMDSFKSKQTVKSPVHALIHFLIDQLLHISILFLISILGEKQQYLLFIKEDYVKIAVVFVFVVFFMSIFIQYLLKIFFPVYKNVLFFKNEKLVGDSTRLLLFIFYMLSFWLSNKAILFFIPLLFIFLALLYNKRMNHLISLRYFIVRLTMDFLVSTLGFYFLIYL